MCWYCTLRNFSCFSLMPAKHCVLLLGLYNFYWIYLSYIVVCLFCLCLPCQIVPYIYLMRNPWPLSLSILRLFPVLSMMHGTKLPAIFLLVLLWKLHNSYRAPSLASWVILLKLFVAFFSLIVCLPFIPHFLSYYSSACAIFLLLFLWLFISWFTDSVHHGVCTMSVFAVHCLAFCLSFFCKMLSLFILSSIEYLNTFFSLICFLTWFLFY